MLAATTLRSFYNARRSVLRRALSAPTVRRGFSGADLPPPRRHDYPSLEEGDVGIGDGCFVPIRMSSQGGSTAPADEAHRAHLARALQQGFEFKVKQTASDFIVAEISKSGVVAAVTEPLKAPEKEIITPESIQAKVDSANQAREALGRLLERTSETAVAEALQRLDSLGQTGMSEFVVFPFSGSKDQRRQVHALLREMCPDFVSDTVVPSGPDDPDGHRIRVWHKDHRPQNQETRNQRSTKRGRGRGRGRGREREHDNVGQNRNNSKSQRTKHGLPVFQERRDKWAHPETEYLQFVLEKRNIDTPKALHLLARTLGIKPTRFRYAGLKDSRAETTQVVTAYRLSHDHLAQRLLNPELQWYDSSNRSTLSDSRPANAKGNPVAASADAQDKKRRSFVQMRVGNLALVPDAQYVGNLAGNRFTLRLRDVAIPDTSLARSPEEFVEACVENWQTRGFVNFFGMQRFGINAEAPTHAVGRALLRREYRTALDLVLRSGRTGAGIHSNNDVHSPNGRAASPRGHIPRSQKRYAPHVVNLHKHMRDNHAQWWEVLHTDGHRLDRIPDSVCRDVLRQLPSNMTRLYLHGYQSFVWNRLASDRMLHATSPPSRQAAGADNDLLAPGFDAKERLSRSELTAMQSVLSEDEIRLDDFCDTGLQVSPLGSVSRSLIVWPDDVSFQWLPSDTASQMNSALPDLLIQFQLPKGAYATCAMRELSRRPISWE